MPLVRKIIQVGDAWAVSLPKSWIVHLWETEGNVREVLMEVDAEIRIRPYIRGKSAEGVEG